MLITGTTITVYFRLEPSGIDFGKDHYDIIVIKPDGSQTYTDDGLTTYLAPTASAQGLGTFDHLIDQAGRYKFVLATGDSDSYTELLSVEGFVITPSLPAATTVINRRIETDLGT